MTRHDSPVTRLTQCQSPAESGTAVAAAQRPQRRPRRAATGSIMSSVEKGTIGALNPKVRHTAFYLNTVEVKVKGIEIKSI